MPGLGSAIHISASGTYANNTLQNLALTAATDASLSAAGFSLALSAADPLVLTYSSSTATLSFTGGATVTLDVSGQESAVDVTARGTISGNALQILDLAVASDASLTLGGVSVTSSPIVPLTLDYASANDQFTFSGYASVVLPGPSNGEFAVTAAGTASSGSLQSLTLSILTVQVSPWPVSLSQPRAPARSP